MRLPASYGSTAITWGSLPLVLNEPRSALATLRGPEPPPEPRIQGGIVPTGAEAATEEKINCVDCGKSFAPPTYNRICKQVDKTGKLKCIGMYMSKRKVFNSAKVRIQGNEQNICVFTANI